MSVNLAREATGLPDRYDYTGYIRPLPQRCTKECLTIILDLDETLIRTFRPEDKMDPKLRKHKDYFKFTIGGEKFEGIKRPYLDEFLLFLSRIANPIIIFTAATRNYAEEIIKVIFPHPERQPFALFSQENCTGKSVIKPIDLVFEKHGDFMDENSLLILDDRQSAYFESDQGNLVVIPKFTGNLNDNMLKRTKDLFLNLRTLMKTQQPDGTYLTVFDFDIKHFLATNYPGEF